MGFLRADLHLFIQTFSFVDISSLLIPFVNPSKTLDPKILALANGSPSLDLTQISNPKEIVVHFTILVSRTVLINKLWYRSTKPLSELFVKNTILTSYSLIPAVAVKLALYTIGKNVRINMEDRKERTFFIISTVALAALMTPHILKIHRKTYTFTIRELIGYSVTQITVHILVIELLEWNAKIIEREIDSASIESVPPLLKYRAIGEGVQRAIEEKIDGAYKSIKTALENSFLSENQTSEVLTAGFVTFVQNHPELLNKLSLEEQWKWNQALFNKDLSQVWPVPLTEDHLNLIQGNNLPIFHAYFMSTPFFFLLSEETRRQLNDRFVRFSPTKNGKELDQTLSEIEEKDLEKDLPSYSIKDRHLFYSYQTENTPQKYRWKSLSFLDKFDYNLVFYNEGLSILPFC